MINDCVVAIAFLMIILVLIVIAVIIGLKTPPYKPTRRERYESYIHSRKWRTRRARALMLGGYKCKWCGSRTALEVHHLTYDRLGREKDKDLVVLCQECHSELHPRYHKKVHKRKF